MQTKVSIYIKRIAVLAVMTALAVICSLTFPLGLTVRVGDFIKLSPVFLITALTGSLYGWKGSALVAFLSDIIQGLMFGNVSLLIALISLLSGAVFGLLLHNTKSVSRIAVAVLITQIICSLVLVTSVLCFKFGMPLFPTIYWRILQTAILIAVEIPVLYLLITVLNLPGKLKNIGKIQ